MKYCVLVLGLMVFSFGLGRKYGAAVERREHVQGKRPHLMWEGKPFWITSPGLPNDPKRTLEDVPKELLEADWSRCECMAYFKKP